MATKAKVKSKTPLSPLGKKVLREKGKGVEKPLTIKKIVGKSKGK